MKSVIFFTILFLNIFVENSSATKIPKWVSDSSSSCKEYMICGIGSGNTLSLAKVDAKNNILRYFETSISSTFKSSISADSININTFQSEESTEVSNGILRGVKIEKTFDDGNKMFYALAVLDKNIVEKEIRNDIEKIDARMQILLDEKKSKYNKELEKLYQKRELLNRRYLVLTEHIIPEVIKREQIFLANKKNKDLTSTFYIEEYKGYKSQIASYIENAILSDDYNITKSKEKANKIITINLEEQDLYLNVDGFKKEMYSIRIEILNKKGKALNSLSKEFIQTGRSHKQIFEIMNMEIKNFIQENINQII